MGRYKFYCSKIEKDDIKTLYAFFTLGKDFIDWQTDKVWDMGGLDWVTIGSRIGKLVNLKIK